MSPLITEVKDILDQPHKIQRSLMGFSKEVKMIGKQAPSLNLQRMVFGEA
jgi:hypothetical protein